MNKTFGWKEQLDYGEKGMELFLKAYSNDLIRLRGTGPDFKVRESGEYLELKTDSYDLSTGNFFLERYSKKHTKAPGGPWQALHKGCSQYAYLYLKSGKWFHFFNLDKLIEKVETIVKEKGIPLTDVHNKTYVTQGYKIPRHLLKDLYKEHDMNEDLRGASK